MSVGAARRARAPRAPRAPRAAAGLLAGLACLCSVGSAADQDLAGEPRRDVYDGVADDLLTAGLGETGLRGAVPEFTDALRPTWRELRRRTVFQNYRGLVDVSAEGGYGRLYGARDGERIAGVEYLATVRSPAGSGTGSVLVQIPAAFDLRRPCLVVVASSGSRGIFGGLPTAGEWGLRRGCAVAHTDKGTGIGLYEVDRDLGIAADGRVVAGPERASSFTPARADVAGLPRHALAFKHAHSRSNPESRWGEHVLQAGRVAFELLNREFAARRSGLTPGNTLVIGAGISNGGGAILRALERDRAGFFDGAVVAEPNVAVEAVTGEFRVSEAGEARSVRVRGLYDYATLHALLQPCAVLAEDAADLPLAAPLAPGRARQEAWCAALARDGVVDGTDAGAQARGAREQLLAAGVHRDALRLGAMNLQFGLWTSVASTYVAAYSRAPAAAHPCGFVFAAVDPQGRTRALDDSELVRSFADLNGIAPGGGIAVLRRTDAGEASVGAANELAAVRCLRAQLPSVQDGLAEIAMTARTGRRPVVVLHGRDDSLVSVNHAARAYAVANWRALGVRDGLRYYELPGVQHFDAFLPLPGMRGRYRPMQPQLNAALDLLHERLASGRPLPPSQVVREAISRNPGADAIVWRGGLLSIPR
jgi:hydroxybutyrate-dimer hydrolase